MTTTIAANELKLGMKIGFMNLFPVTKVATAANGDIYYKSLFGKVKRVNGRRLLRVSYRSLEFLK